MQTRSIPLRVGVHEAKIRLSQLLRMVAAGHEIEIAERHEPVARLVPSRAPNHRQLGIDSGAFTVPDEFDARFPGEIFDSFHP